MGQGLLYVVSPCFFVKSKPWSDNLNWKIFDPWLVDFTMAGDASYPADQELEQALASLLAAPRLHTPQHRSNG